MTLRASLLLYRPTMDRLSQVLDLIEVHGVVSGSSDVGEGRQRREVVDDLVLVAVVDGGALLRADGVEGAVRLEAGDVAVLNGRSWLALEGGRGDVVIDGRVELGANGRELLLEALPPVVHVDASSPVGPRVRGLVDRLSREMSAGRVGSDFAIRQYGQLLVLEILRALMEGGELRVGWLNVMADERLRPAVALIHDQPATRWSLADLARASAMSRTAFAERFREVAGEPPLSYLTGWRMLLARRELRVSDVGVRPLGLRLGYSSESSFSNAFKRRVGESPSSYRARTHREADASVT
jgi:AraC-like DNA-binding protein